MFVERCLVDWRDGIEFGIVLDRECAYDWHWIEEFTWSSIVTSVHGIIYFRTIHIFNFQFIFCRIWIYTSSRLRNWPGKVIWLQISKFIWTFTLIWFLWFRWFGWFFSFLRYWRRITLNQIWLLISFFGCSVSYVAKNETTKLN